MSMGDYIAKFASPAFLALLGLAGMMYCLEIPWLPVFIGFATFVVTRHFMVCRMGSSQRLEAKVLFGHRSNSPGPAYWTYVLGSGGHTAELVQMIELHHRPCSGVDRHRRYVITAGDASSEARVHDLEEDLYRSDYDLSKANKDAKTYGYVVSGDGSSDIQVVFGDTSDGDHDDAPQDDGPFTATWDYLVMPRARAVHQSFLTACFSSLVAALAAVIWMTEGPPMRRHREPRSVYSRFYKYPHVIVTNGPGSGFIVAVVAHLLKMFFLAPQDRLKVVFIETWAHVNTLSLTGKLFHWTGIAEVFAVQHRALAERYGKFYYPIITDRMRRVAE